MGGWVGGWVGWWVGGWVGGWWRRVAYEAFQIHEQTLEPKKRDAGTWVDDEELPPVGVKVSASSRDPATVKGVQHKKCTAKQLREKFHHRRNQLKKMDEAWEQGQQISYNRWYALKTRG